MKSGINTCRCTAFADDRREKEKAEDECRGRRRNTMINREQMNAVNSEFLREAASVGIVLRQ